MGDSSETDHGDDAARRDDTESGLSDGNWGYRAVVFGVVAIGGIAVVAGVAGLFVVLTGGFDGGEEFDVLGEYECEEFEADPEVVHDAEYETEREILSPSEVSEFDATLTDDGVTVTLVPDGVLLAASATGLDGEAIDVTTDDDRVFLERETTSPFRLWVDLVAEDGTVTRMQLDICPPR